MQDCRLTHARVIHEEILVWFFYIILLFKENEIPIFIVKLYRSAVSMICSPTVKRYEFKLLLRFFIAGQCTSSGI